MKSEKKTEIKVGITVFIALILFALIYGWAKNLSFNSKKLTLNIKFDTVAGLEIGDVVTINGVKKGLVDNIFIDNNQAIVNVKFNEEVDLREDATFSIMMLDLMGGKKVEIFSGISNNKLDFKEIQQGKFGGDISSLVSIFSNVDSDIVEIVNGLKTTMNYLNTLFSDKNFDKNITSSIKNIQLITNDFSELIHKNKFNISNSLQQSNELITNLNNIVSVNDTNLISTIQNLKFTTDAFNSLLEKLNLLSNEILEKRNNIGKLIYDENLIKDLKVTLNQLKELTEILNNQLKEGGLEVKAKVDLF